MLFFCGNLFAQGSDTIERLGNRYRTEATHQTDQFDHYRFLASQSSNFLLALVEETQSPSELSMGVKILVFRGLSQTKIQQPFETNQVLSLIDDDIRYEYRKWMKSEESLVYTDEAKLVFDELASVLNGEGRWSLLNASADAEETMALLSATPHIRIFDVLEAWDVRSSEPNLWRNSLHNLLSLVVLGVFTARMPYQPVASNPIWVRSAKSRRPIRVLLKETSAGRQLTMRQEPPLFPQNGGSAPKGFALETMPKNVTKNGSFRFKDLKVLVVDDELLEIACFRNQLLRRHAKVVHSAPNGQVAIDMAATTRYDVILMDLQMPVKNGMEAIREIRIAGLNRKTPAICTSRNAEPGLSNRLYRAGFDAHFRKHATDVRQLESFMNIWVEEGLIIF